MDQTQSTRHEAPPICKWPPSNSEWLSLGKTCTVLWAAEVRLGRGVETYGPVTMEQGHVNPTWNSFNLQFLEEGISACLLSLQQSRALNECLDI